MSSNNSNDNYEQSYHKMSVRHAHGVIGGNWQDFEEKAKSHQWHDYGRGQQFRVVPTKQDGGIVAKSMPFLLQMRKKPVAG